MTSAVSGDDPVPEGLYSEINVECSEGPFASAIKSGGYALGYFQRLGEYLRNIFLPHINGIDSPFYIEMGEYAAEFVSRLKGNNNHHYPTFSNLEKIIEHFVLKDIPINIKHENTTYHFTVRIIESKKDFNGKKLRLILSSIYDHQVSSGNSLSKWDPKSMDELSGAVLEILKTLQENGEDIDTLMTFSLGTVTWDGLKHLKAEDTTIPKTIIVNRGLASTEKIIKKLYPNAYPIINNIIWLTHLNADPERELLQYFRRVQHSNSASMEGRRVILLEAKYDRYFSDTSAFDPDYHEQLEATGVETYRGSYFAIPGVVLDDHHVVREDLMINTNQEVSKGNFVSDDPYESLSDTLVKNVFSKDGTNTCLIIGGNRDNLDSITYLRAVPLLFSFIKLCGE